MSNNQLHGKTYEDHLKSAFQGSADHERSPMSPWDIEKDYDKINKLPTSIKTTGSNVVDLADARKFWSVKEPYRLLVAQYKQTGDVKNFHTLYEFHITAEEHVKLLGDVTSSEVEDFHNALLSYGKGFHNEARQFAKLKKASLKYRSVAQLNQKIDSKAQRRLQCSITLAALLANVKDRTIYSSTEFYRKISVSFSIQSSKRELNK
jgi:hypothetical protein